ncbi:Pycsar system effector family protein [Paraburkholderia heleia]|uniref:Pycsar system effector family protein n=1 Tax=Paraburkholderia heleia TaxID=634127 RepID=UPI002AB7C82B|nr:Pycsar system effector family protein [Paraburkholderia heleia]
MAMAKNDQEEIFEKLMTANLARVVDFVKFAEAKNAALLTFCSAWILASMNLLSSDKPAPLFVVSGLKLALPFFAIAACMAIGSFIPRLSTRGVLKSKLPGHNMLYFGDIAQTSIDSFQREAKERYMPQGASSITEKYIDDLSMQIVVNSRIAARKMQLFNYGAYTLLLALFWVGAPAIGQIL